MSEYKEIVKDGVKNIGNRMKKFFLYVTGVSLFGFTSYLVIRNFTYRHGTRSTYLLKITKFGYIFKTYEGTLVLAATAPTNHGLISNNWDSSVRPNKVYPALEYLQRCLG